MFSVHEVHDSLFLYTCLRLHFIMTNCLSNMIINPRRACAARVTVVVLCVCLFVCLSGSYVCSRGAVLDSFTSVPHMHV